MNRAHSVGWRLVAVVFLTASSILTAPTGPVAADNDHRDRNNVRAPSAELTAQWWQWVLSNPNTNDETCAQRQLDRVFFLPGVFANGALTRTCTIPAGRQILVPVLNVADGAGAFDCEPTVPGVPCDVRALRALAASNEDNPRVLEASIDGDRVEHVRDFRVRSPVFRIVIPSGGGAFGLLPGSYFPNVSDGYWLLIDPLPAGRHTLHLHGVTNINAPFPTDADVTYHLIVQRDRDDRH